MKEKKEKSYHHGNLKKALVDSAMQIIAAEGYKSLTLRKVAVHAGVSVGAPYRHYKNAEELLSEVASEGIKILSARIKKIMEQKPNNYLWQFQTAGIAYIEFAIEHKELFRIMYGSHIEHHSDHEYLKNEGQLSFQLLVDIIENAQKEGTVKKADAYEVALSAWSMVHGVAHLILEKQIFFDETPKGTYKTLIKNLLKHLYKGIQAS